MADPTLEELRGQLRALTAEIREAEKAYARAVETAADAEAVYRAELAKALKGHRKNGAGVGEADTLAKGDVVAHSRERDATTGKVRHAAEVLEDRRDDRRNLWRLVDAIRGPRPSGTNTGGGGGERWP